MPVAVLNLWVWKQMAVYYNYLRGEEDRNWSALDGVEVKDTDSSHLPTLLMELDTHTDDCTILLTPLEVPSY